MMKAFIVQFPFGVVAFNEEKQLVEKALFPRKHQAAAKSLLKAEQGKLSDQTTSLVTLLNGKGYDVFVFQNGKVAEEAQKRLKIAVEVIEPTDSAAFMGRMAEIAFESEFAADQTELDSWNRNVSMELSKLRIKGATGKRDLIVSQGIQTLDSLDQTVNLFMARLREWYGVYFPELDRLVEKHETYARLVMNLGAREGFTQDALEADGVAKDRAALIAKAAEGSMGADINERDLAQVQQLSRDVLAFYKLRESMEQYVDHTMEEMAPNIRAVAGALLGARMISIAGSLQNLAMRPASTIQVLGAEKALFRSLKTGARPPKHGLIFQHTLLHDAKRWQRGKIARVIAGKLAIAARADAFGEGHYIGDQLKNDINVRIDEIREKYKEAPPPKEPKPKEKREGFGYRDGGDRRGGERRFDRNRDRFSGNRDREGGGERRFTYREPPRDRPAPPQQRPQEDSAPRTDTAPSPPPQQPQGDREQRPYNNRPREGGGGKQGGGKFRRKQWRDNRGRSS